MILEVKHAVGGYHVTPRDEFLLHDELKLLSRSRDVFGKKNHGPLYVLQVTKTRMYRWKGVGTLHYNHQSFPGEVFTDDV